MRKQKYDLYLDSTETSVILHSLIKMKNTLIGILTESVIAQTKNERLIGSFVCNHRNGGCNGNH